MEMVVPVSELKLPGLLFSKNTVNMSIRFVSLAIFLISSNNWFGFLRYSRVGYIIRLW